MAQIPARFPAITETLNHPAYPSTIWNLEPHSSGKLACAKNRGGPVTIAWEIHGEGPAKLILVMGLAGVKTSWQRQTKHFGHDHADRYSVLLIDNRGMGESDKPLMRYSTSEMAKDLLEVLDHVGWTDPQSVHLVGISLGGMIAQELACMVPDRLRTLTLLCTAATVENTKSFHESWAERLKMAVPKSPERSIEDTSQQVFVKEWLFMPDEGAELPTPSTPKCKPANGGGPYLKFESNFQRFQAQELAKRGDATQFTRTGFLLQLIAAGWHRKTEAQLKAMADVVGRERIAVMHGTGDNMIDVYHGRKLIEYIEPGVGLIVDGMGHAPVFDRVQWFNGFLAERIAFGEKLAAQA